MDNNDILKKVISHSKANGFIYQSSEIYDGLSAVYDYGPYGSEPVSYTHLTLPTIYSV